MNLHGPKVKISRWLGVAITAKAARVLEKRPGGAGIRGFRKPSVYKRQLIEKQRLRAQDMISERQMRNYFRKALKKIGNTEENLLVMLESRLTTVVLRAGIASTISAARQFVSHRHILVNGKIVNVASFEVRPGDVVSVREKSRKIPVFQQLGQLPGVLPPHFLSQPEGMAVKMMSRPNPHDIPFEAELSLVVEYYSR
jgi:small subunit ribosomal protein S4